MALTVTRGQSACCVLSQDPAQVGRAREEARKALFGWGLGEHADLAGLILSELATNAIRYGEGPVRVRISHVSGQLRVAVHDQGAGRPVRCRVTADEESGRGLALLDSLIGLHGGSRRTISDRAGPGKTVYVVIGLAGAG
jgi:anti-sigma regulatory factor (Ser/Thr protein kinase)